MSDRDEQKPSDKDDDEIDVEWLVNVAGLLGMNRIRVRWKLLSLARKWSALGRDGSPATSRRFRHQKCWSCQQIRDLDETRCGNCGSRLGSKPAAFMRSLGFVVPPSLAVSSLLFTLNLAVYLRVWLVDGTSLFSLSQEALHACGAHGSYGFLEPSNLWRLGAAMFLHFNLLHLAMNLISLMQVGPSVEDLLGRGEMLLAYLVTGLVGNFVSELRPTPFIGAGASGAVMGLVGLAAGLGHAAHSIDGRAVRDRMLRWGAYTLLFGLMVGADNLAHAGGFISGGLWGLLRAKAAVFRGAPPSHPALGAVGALLLLTSGLPPLLVRVDKQALELQRQDLAYEAPYDAEPLADCDQTTRAHAYSLWNLLPPESRQGTFEEYVARFCSELREQAAASRKLALATKPRELPAALPTTSVSLDALFAELESSAAGDGRAAFEAWARSLALQLKSRKPIAVPGLHGSYRVVERPLLFGDTRLDIDATSDLAPLPEAGAAAAVPRALRKLLATHNVALPVVGSFLVRPCAPGEQAPCAAFVLGQDLERYAKGELDPAELTAALRKPPPPPSQPSAARGIALVEQVIRHVRENKLLANPVPMPAQEIAALTLPGGRPLPPSVRRWLAFDRSLVMRASQNRFSAFSVREVWSLIGSNDAPEWLARLSAMFPGDFLVLGLPVDDSVVTLYLAAADESGEVPIVAFDVDDIPTCYVDAGFDVWLALAYRLPGYKGVGGAPPRVLFDALGGREQVAAW